MSAQENTDLAVLKKTLGEKFAIKRKNSSGQSLTDADVMDIISLVSGYISDDARKDRMFAIVRKTAQGGAPLHVLVNQAASFLGRSLVVIDFSFRLLDHSTSVAVTDPLWIHNIARGFCSYRFMSEMKKLLPEDPSVNENRAFPVNCDYSTENKLCCRLVWQNSVIGYVALIDNNRGILPYHIEYLPVISALIVQTLAADAAYESLFAGTGNNIYAALLHYPEKTDELLREYQPANPPHRRLVCIEVKCGNHSLIDLSYLQRQMESMFPSGIFFIYEEYLTGVLPEEFLDRLPAGDSTFFANIKEVGISSAFERPEDFPGAFENAKTACRLAARTRSSDIIHYYDHYAFYDILSRVSEPEIMKSYVHPLLSALHEYDLSHGANLLDTLELYLQCGQNAKRTAEKMFIHRNTLNYRLAKIREISGKSEWSPEEVFRLSCSFKINRLLHLI